MAFWTTFLALALGPLVQFQKKFLGTIYQIWWGIGPIFSLLGPILWEELHYKGIKWCRLVTNRPRYIERGSPYLCERDEKRIITCCNTSHVGLSFSLTQLLIQYRRYLLSLNKRTSTIAAFLQNNSSSSKIIS